MKRPWFFIALLTLALSLGIVGGTVIAQNASADGDGEGTRQSFAARVAQILGKSEGEVQGAFNQVHREQQNERVARLLQYLEEKEKIDAEGVEALQTWFEQRPDAALYMPGLIFRSAESVDRMLDRWVEKGRLSEDAAQAVRDWIAERPEVLEEHIDERGPGRPGFHNRFHRRHGRGDAWYFFREAPPAPAEESASGQTSL